MRSRMLDSASLTQRAGVRSLPLALMALFSVACAPIGEIEPQAVGDAPVAVDASSDAANPIESDARSTARADAAVLADDAAGTAQNDTGLGSTDGDLADLHSAARQLRLHHVFHRQLQARAYQNHHWAIDGESPASVGRALAQLRPTFVSGLMRIANDETISAQQIADFNTIRSLVRASSPGCVFDVVLNAEQYTTQNEITTKMREVTTALGTDIVFFDFFQTANRARPDVIRAAIHWAHERDIPVGGNSFGGDYPAGSDYIDANDGQFDLDLVALRHLIASGLPVNLHINNNPQNGAATESCIFIQDYSTERREAYVAELARHQDDQHYNFMYPVFFPECPPGHAYAATQDRDMLDRMQRLLDNYNH